jgi:hypothetical protein
MKTVLMIASLIVSACVGYFLSQTNPSPHENDSADKNLSAYKSKTVDEPIVKRELAKEAKSSVVASHQQHEVYRELKGIEAQYEDKKLLSYFVSDQVSTDLKYAIISEKLSEDQMKTFAQILQEKGKSNSQEYFKKIEETLSKMPNDQYHFERASLLTFGAKIYDNPDEVKELAKKLLFESEVPKSEDQKDTGESPVVDDIGGQTDSANPAHILPIVSHSLLLINTKDSEEAKDLTDQAINKYEDKQLEKAFKGQLQEIHGL